MLRRQLLSKVQKSINWTQDSEIKKQSFLKVTRKPTARYFVYVQVVEVAVFHFMCYSPNLCITHETIGLAAALALNLGTSDDQTVLTDLTDIVDQNDPFFDL